jgi:hypothetical protein
MVMSIGFAPFGIRPTIAAPHRQCTNPFGKKYDVKDQHLEDMRHRLIAQLPTIAHPITLSAATNRARRDCETKRFGGLIVDNKVYFSIINRHKPLGQLRPRLANLSRTPTISLAGTGLLYK